MTARAWERVPGPVVRDRAPAPVYYGLAVVDVARVGGVGVGLRRSLGAVPSHRGADVAGAQMPSAPDTPSTGTWTTPRPALTGMSLLQTWTGSWLPLAFTRLSLLKPLGPEAAWGHRGGFADESSRRHCEREGAVLTRHACLPQRNFTDSARDSRVTMRVQTVTLHDRP